MSKQSKVNDVFIFISIILSYSIFSCKEKEVKYTVCWRERIERRGEGHCRHNGILTDSGYLFTDTIYDHKLKKMVVLTTLLSITKSKRK